MFIDEKELIEFKIYYKKVGRHYIAFNEGDFQEIDIPSIEKLDADQKKRLTEEDKKKMTEEEKAKFKVVNIRARPLTWGLYNELQEEAVVKDNLGNRQWNYKRYKEVKLRRIIAEWDVKTTRESDGQTVTAPVSPNQIATLSPDVAEVILNTYDKIMIMDEAEEKK